MEACNQAVAGRPFDAARRACMAPPHFPLSRAENHAGANQA